MVENINGSRLLQLIVFSAAFIFSAGSLFGWVFEVLFRRFFTAKKWINPGFLKGPYLPLYGFGALAMFGVCFLRYINPIPDTVTGYKFLWGAVIVLLICAIITLLEFITGLLFIKKLHIRLWDYSRTKRHIMGIICPKYIFLWTVMGAIFYCFLFEPLCFAAAWCADKPIAIFLVGLFLGIMLFDLFFTIIGLLKNKRSDKNYS